jgi:hypothetical protein
MARELKIHREPGNNLLNKVGLVDRDDGDKICPSIFEGRVGRSCSTPCGIDPRQINRIVPALNGNTLIP